MSGEARLTSADLGREPAGGARVAAGAGAATQGAGRVLAVHRQAPRIVSIRGERSGDKLRVQAQEFSESEWSVRASRAVEEGVESIVVVTPGAQTIGRVGMVPLADAAQMVQAAQLLAEAQLPDSIPAHRRGAGVLPGHAEGTVVPTLMVAWRGNVPTLAAPAQAGVRWCPGVAALAALRGQGTGTAWFADPSDGSISVVSGTGTRLSARIAIEDNSSAVLWGEGVAATVGGEFDGVEMEPRLGLEEEAVAALARRVDGARVTREWLDRHGLALGALMIALGNEGSLAPLAGLTAEPPKVEEHALLRAASWLGAPRHAAWVIAASLVLLVGGPLGIAWARVAILDSKSKSLAAATEARKELDKRAAVYAELNATRWPMTKLLSDISQATPQGIVVTDLHIQPEVGLSGGGQSQGVTINGVADSQSKVYDLQNNLNNAGIFRGVKPGTTAPRAEGGVTFGFTMGVGSPHGALPANEEWNWASKNLAVRLHGEGASIKTPPVGTASAGSVNERPTRRASRSEDEGEEKGESKAAAKKDSSGIPVALTDDQIAKMDRGMAMREMAARRTYSQKNPSLDASTKRRLEDEATKLKERMEVLRNAAGKAESK